jgi:outer membrane protein insertion porin family
MTPATALVPTQGHLAAFEFEQVIGTFVYSAEASSRAGSSSSSTSADGSGRHVLSVGSVLGMSGPNTPAYDNFYAGGYNTLRGFVFRGSKPAQERGDHRRSVRVARYRSNASSRSPPTTPCGASCSPISAPSSRTSAINQMRSRTGVGLRITLPAMGPAPIALDLAVPVVYAPYDSQQLFSFFVGFAR